MNYSSLYTVLEGFEVWLKIFSIRKYLEKSKNFDFDVENITIVLLLLFLLLP